MKHAYIVQAHCYALQCERSISLLPTLSQKMGKNVESMLPTRVRRKHASYVNREWDELL